MNSDVESIKSCIESYEGIIHKRCEQLRELVFMGEDYSPDEVIQIASDIKLLSDIIISQSGKLQRS
jgi:hypothetical protein